MELTKPLKYEKCTIMPSITACRYKAADGSVYTERKYDVAINICCLSSLWNSLAKYRFEKYKKIPEMYWCSVKIPPRVDVHDNLIINKITNEEKTAFEMDLTSLHLARQIYWKHAFLLSLTSEVS